MYPVLVTQSKGKQLPKMAALCTEGAIAAIIECFHKIHNEFVPNPNPFCPRRGHCIEFFVSKKWFNLQDYLAETVPSPELTSVIMKNTNWNDESLQHFRHTMCVASLLNHQLS